jgi:hypothetical protein
MAAVKVPGHYWIKAVALAVRLIVLGPAVYRLLSGLDAAIYSDAEILPFSRFWHVALANITFGLLCISPYPDSVLKNYRKYGLLAVQVLTFAILMRYEFLPVHFTDVGLKDLPAHQQEYEEALAKPSGRGFFSSRTENGVTIWLVQKPEYSLDHVSSFTAFYSAPFILLLFRLWERRLYKEQATPGHSAKGPA